MMRTGNIHTDVKELHKEASPSITPQVNVYCTNGDYEGPGKIIRWNWHSNTVLVKFKCETEKCIRKPEQIELI